jgi:hypothetical protein
VKEKIVLDTKNPITRSIPLNIDKTSLKNNNCSKTVEKPANNIRRVCILL